MRGLIIIIIALGLYAHGWAECRYSGIYIISSGLTLNRNPIILIEFYHSSQSLVNNLNTKYPVYLKSKNNKISLIIKEILKGNFGTTQVVFQSSSLLTTNDSYKLVIENLPKYETIDGIFNGRYTDNKNVIWKVSAQIDKDKPLLTTQPNEVKKTRVEYGCGPAEWVYFKIPSENNSAVFVRAILKHISTGKTTTLLLLLENGSVKIGHGMCSGMISFNDSEIFQIKFSLVDISGNNSNWSKAILFSKPKISTMEE